MKKTLLLLGAALTLVSQSPVHAQMGSPSGSAADNALTKIFGSKLNFSATMELQVLQIVKPGTTNDVASTAKMSFADGNSRTEMDLTKMSGSQMPPHGMDQMKAMGMDQMISITRNDTKNVYMIYPGLQSYAKLTSPDANQGTNDYKVETTELGKETLDGHACVKNKYVVTNNKNAESITMLAWLATDLKDYPIKLEINSADSNRGRKVPTITTMHFVNIDTTKPDASLFEPPVGYHVYVNVQAMLQTEMMKKMSGGGAMPGLPPGHP
jgi:hypothetical protein